LRRSLQRIVALIACLSWGITALGFLIMETMHRYPTLNSAIIDGVKGAVGEVLVYYWSCYVAYSEVLREVLQPLPSPLPPLIYSPKALAVCILECALHLFVFIPATDFSIYFSVFGTENGLSLDELCYLTILVRNYHSLRLLYWYSSFSTLHTNTLVNLVRVDYSISFLLRCFFVHFGLPLVLAAYGAMVLIPGLCEYLFEHEANTNKLGIIWNNFWVVFYTQTTIGYGEEHPETFFGQFVILISALFGYFTLGLLNSISSQRTALSLRECTFYSEVRYRHEQQRYLPETTVLIQRWWRLMLMRLRKKLEVRVILAYFEQLRIYRNVLVACARVKDTRFERQIAAFGSAVKPPLRSLQEYLAPIVESRSLIIDVYRSAYNSKIQCVSLLRLTHKYAQLVALTPRIPSSLSSDRFRRPTVAKSSQGRAKAKKAAFQNLMSRLVVKANSTSS